MRVDRCMRLLQARGMLDEICNLCSAHRVSVADLLAGRRYASVCRARRYAYVSLRERYQLSYPEIGALLGVHHTAVMHGINTMREELRLQNDRLTKGVQ